MKSSTIRSLEVLIPVVSRSNMTRGLVNTSFMGLLQEIWSSILGSEFGLFVAPVFDVFGMTGEQDIRNGQASKFFWSCINRRCQQAILEAIAESRFFVTEYTRDESDHAISYDSSGEFTAG